MIPLPLEMCPRAFLVTQMGKNLSAMQETQVQSLGWERSSPVFLPGESHGQRSLASYSPLGRKGSDATEQFSKSEKEQEKEPESLLTGPRVENLRVPRRMGTFVLSGGRVPPRKILKLPGVGEGRLQGTSEILVFISESHLLLGSGRKQAKWKMDWEAPGL